MTDDLETRFPELFEAASSSAPYSGLGGKPTDVRLRCIVDADGTVIAGKLPPPDPPHWAQIEIAGGPRPWDPEPEPVREGSGYRGRRQ